MERLRGVVVVLVASVVLFRWLRIPSPVSLSAASVVVGSVVSGFNGDPVESHSRSTAFVTRRAHSCDAEGEKERGVVAVVDALDCDTKEEMPDDKPVNTDAELANALDDDDVVVVEVERDGWDREGSPIFRSSSSSSVLGRSVAREEVGFIVPVVVELVFRGLDVLLEEELEEVAELDPPCSRGVHVIPFGNPFSGFLAAETEE